MNRDSQISQFKEITQVSRETLNSLKIFEKVLINSNSRMNLIGNSTINNIWSRHFLDSAQLIDFIDKNDKIVTDLGTGAGFPGIILEIMARERNLEKKFNLIEKSSKKSSFLKHIISELKLESRVFNLNLFESYKEMEFEVVTARAFKPLNKIFEFFTQKATSWKKIFVFLGKTGKNELHQASKFWEIEYKQRESVTSSDSLIIEIDKIKKKID